MSDQQPTTHRDDGLSAFDGFTRRAASAGMFNDDQVAHMRALSEMPREAKCGCGWFVRFDCANCNEKELAARGVTMARKSPYGLEEDYVLTDGRRVDYSGAVAWLKVSPAPPAGREPER